MNYKEKLAKMTAAELKYLAGKLNIPGRAALTKKWAAPTTQEVPYGTSAGALNGAPGYPSFT